ncbi:MAG TPA: LytR C-terminal domain-containing protein [Solirubrobacteraceae bacterium]|nr:LytR C-terminal domain-containing protein [Solirubrobacteraceae bacterium]
MVAVVPYALSVHGFIAKIGSYAGFAAIIGVALVVIMLFVHARETASLRERAEDAEDRVDYLEQALEQLERQTAQATQLAQASQPQPQSRAGVGAPPVTARTASPSRPAPAAAAAYAATARPTTSGPTTSGPPPQLPAAPFGTAGPALSSATRLLPDVDPAGANGRVNGNGASGAAAPAPATAAAGAPVPMPQIPSAGRGSEARAEAGAPDRRPDAADYRAPRRVYGRAAESGPRRRLLPALAAVLLVVVIAVALVLLLGHGHRSGHSAASTARTHSSTTRSGGKGTHRVAVNPRTVTVAVLNGTTTSNLAAHISQKLGQLGFKPGRTGNFSSQSLTTTTIGFVPGHRPQALAVAKALKVKYSNVLQVTAATKALVCPAGSTCPDQVFVVLGSDLASSA